MAITKTQEEIGKLREGGKILSDALAQTVGAIRVGVMLSELDKIAEDAIRSAGAEPSFLLYKTHKYDPPFPSTVCMSVNDEVVHGCGNRDLVLNDGDIVGLDIGCWYKGLCTDMAVTVPVGNVSDEAKQLMEVTKESCYAAANVLKPGAMISDVGRVVEEIVNPHGYGIIRALVGHGVGHEVHEDPRIPNYYDASNDKIKVVEGMVLAVEPMITEGDYRIKTLDDGWSVATIDGSLGAHFEVTLVVTKDGPEIITPLPV